MVQKSRFKRISLAKLIHYLALDPYYASDDPGIESIILSIYENRSHDRRFVEFRKRFNRWPCKNIPHRHLIYLWIGLGLPAYFDGEHIGWDFERRQSLEYWQREIIFEEDELKDFLRQQNFFLPVYFYPDEPDNTIHRMAPKEHAISDEPDNKTPSVVRQDAAAAATAESHPFECFRSMENLKFSEITVRIDPDNLSLRVKARSVQATAAFRYLELQRKNEITLNKQGEVLFAMARNTLSLKAAGVDRAITRLSKSLREAFGTSDVPFSGRAPHFRLKIPKDKDAQVRARRRTVSYEDSRATGDLHDPTSEWLKEKDPQWDADDPTYSDDPDLET